MMKSLSLHSQFHVQCYPRNKRWVYVQGEHFWPTLIKMFPSLNSSASFIQGTMIPDSRPVFAQTVFSASRNSSNLIHTWEFWYYTRQHRQGVVYGHKTLPLVLLILNISISFHRIYDFGWDLRWVLSTCFWRRHLSRRRWPSWVLLSAEMSTFLDATIRRCVALLPCNLRKVRTEVLRDDTSIERFQT